MIDLQDSLKNAVWTRFVQEGVLDESRMSNRVSESWFICRQAGIDPYNGKGVTFLSDEKLSHRKNDNRQLLRAAIPLLNNLQKYFKHTKSLFLLADREGYVLYMNGHKSTLTKADHIHFIQGVKWTEKEVGTNAIGTALRIREPITIIGAEHYAVASHSWVCSSAPIFNEERESVGVLNVSYPIEFGFQEHMLPVVVSASYAIEERLKSETKKEELQLLQYASYILSSDSPMLISNKKGKIVWLTPKLRQEFPNWHSMVYQELQNEQLVVKEKHPLYCMETEEPYLIGYKVVFQKSISRLIRKLSRASFKFEGVKGKSQAFQTVLKQAEKAAKSNITVHIHGETGTGKEVMAKAIHLNSSRKNGPFVAVNCGALEPNLMASELFGYAEGAFTGAKKSGHKGKFEQANGGTLFLDEIGEIPTEMQVALLRVLEEKEVIPVGGTKPIPLDVRVITATNKDLSKLVESGALREDFFYRINVYPIHLPPLKERKEDIPLFIRHYCSQNEWNVSLDHHVIKRMRQHDWPGNVRELHNFLERLTILFGGDSPTANEVDRLLSASKAIGKQPGERKQTLTFREQLEKEKIIDALQSTDGNVTAAAAKLNIARSTFYRKLKKYQL